MAGNRIPDRWLERHNRKAAETIRQADLERWIQRELGGEQ